VKARNFVRVRTPWFSQNCTAIFIATSTATDPNREEDASEIAWHARREPPSQREPLLVSEPAEHDVRHQRELALGRLPNVGMVIAVAGRPPRRDPSISSRPSDSTMREPCVRTTGSGGRAVFICA
jgi:hypothetical protein